jgi:hypothetical protein
LAAAACTTPQVEEPPDLQPVHIVYRLAWDATGLVPIAGGGWSLTNDRGLELRVTEARLYSVRAELVPCHLPKTDAASLLLDALIPSARAGHPGEDRDWAWEEGFAEDVLKLRLMSVGSRRNTGSPACSVHYLMGREGRGEAMKPSLVLRGEQRIGNAAWQPFELVTHLAQGFLQSVAHSDRAPAHGDTAWLTITRQPQRWFHGIESMTAAETVGQILDNFPASVRAEVEYAGWLWKTQP